MRGIKSMKQFIKFASLGLVATAIIGAGCAEPDEINRVQPDLIKKSDLEGEWHTLSTITRAPYASHWVFPGLQGTLDRGTWAIEEDFLYFYQTYEFVEGTEAQGIRSDTDVALTDSDGNVVTYEKTLPDGNTVTVTRYVLRSNPIFRYKIAGHYDVRRSYNPLTGEQSNVINEDKGEKFWYEREFIRVDFGVNTAQNFGGMEFGPGVATIYEGEEGPDDQKLRIEDDGSYMDYSVRGFVEAPRTYLRGWGFVPTCLFYASYTGSYYECDEEEIHARTSFKKVRENNTYQAKNFDDHMLNKFGFYRSARGNFDILYGQTFSDALRHVRRFRIWDEYIKGADGELDYSQMNPNPVVYYLSEDFPRELIPGAMDLARQWDQIFSEVIEVRKGSPPTNAMYILCENNKAEADAAIAAGLPVALSDSGVCKDMEKPKLFGDLRYNLLVSVNDPVQYGLYGYGPMHSDPLTGETVHANAFNYTANMRLGARNAVDMIEYAAGVQSFRDITQARHIQTSVKAKALGNSQGNPRSMSVAGMQAMAGLAMSPNVHTSLTTAPLGAVDTDIATARMTKLLKADDYKQFWTNADMASAVGLPVTSLDLPVDSAMLNDITHPAHLASERILRRQFDHDMKRGTQAICMREAFDDSFRGLALEYKGAYDAIVCEGLSQRMNDGEDFVFDFDAFKEPGADCSANANVCGENQVCEALDQGEVTGSYCMTPCSAALLLDQLRDELRRVNQVSQFVYWDPNALYTDTDDARLQASQAAARELIESKREEVFLEVYDRIWSTVAMHEVGHNVGLRHNFASSTDALNYFDGYWDLKGRDVGDEWQPYAMFEDDTRSQVVNKMREFQQTSIMEYTGAFNARFNGLGSYDRAAILFGYGNLVEVFNNPPNASEWVPRLADPSDTNPDAYSLQQRREQPLARALRKFHHTNYPNVFGGVTNILDRRVVDANEVADMSKPCLQSDNPYDPAVCGVEGSFCQPFPSGQFFCTKPDMVEVPFRFCSDEYNWTQVDCQTHDEGTDTFEIINNTIDDYEAYWPFRAYKRDNDLFNPSTSYWGGVIRFMYSMRKQFEHWTDDYVRYNNNDWWESRFGTPWHEDPNGGLGATVGAMQMFEYLANIFGRPSDGYYAFNVDRKVYEPYVDNGRNDYCNVVQIREDIGARPIYPSYDFSGYLYTPSRAGTFYDRLGAMMFMTYPSSMFTIGVDKAYDLRRFRINFATVWPQRMHNLFSGLVTSDPTLFGWCLEHDDPSIPVDSCTSDPTTVKPRMWFGSDADLTAHYANCEPLVPEPEYDFPTTQYRLPALAAIYGFGWMSYTFDRSFIDRNRMWLEGDGSDIAIADGFETIKYTDPFSGKTYVAMYDPAMEDPYAEVAAMDVVPGTTTTEAQHEFWPAARLLALANTELDKYAGNLTLLTSEYQYSTLQQTVGRLEIMRGLYRYFDFGF
ncbi:MAG: hypothetical protein ACI9MR_000651 [Myxococcota bacterium]|jgi:hypothetical protein